MPFRLIAAVLALLLAGAALPARAAPAPAAAPACAPSVQDRLWMQQALDAWAYTAHDKLRVQAGNPPDLVFYDGVCTYQTGAQARGRAFEGPRLSGRRLAWKADFHAHTIPLPDGSDLPMGVASFAAPYDHDTRAFMVMALPSLWREGGVHSALGLETMMTALFIHEMTHTRQFYGFAPRIAELTRRYGLPDDLNDDSLQEAFKNDPDYVAAFSLERDLLLSAAKESDPARAGMLVARAFELAQARRARFFTGDKAKWAEIEDAFLTLEGVGQWAAWAWLTDPKGGGVAPARALHPFRRGARFWSQDEGFLAMAAIDRLVPDWRERAFAAEPQGVMALWADAAP
jgi:hypothetical protein